MSRRCSRGAERHSSKDQPLTLPGVHRHNDPRHVIRAASSRHAGVPCVSRGERLTLFHGRLFHAHRDFRVPIRGLQADVSEPAADHIHLDTDFEEMDGRRVPKHVKRDPPRGRCRRRGIETGGVLPYAFVAAVQIDGGAEERGNTETPACPVAAIYDSVDAVPASQKVQTVANTVYRSGDVEAFAAAEAIVRRHIDANPALIALAPEHRQAAHG